jgi:hypothetical protein
MDMQNFVSHRTGSPHPVNPKRLANAADARIPIKKGPAAQQPQGQSSIPSRGLGNIQNSSAVLQQAPQHRHSGQGHGQKRDLYDTDAESLDTSVNQSVVQVEDSQIKDQHQQHGQIVDLDHGPDDDGSSEEEDDESDDDELDPEELDVIRENGLEHVSHEKQLDYLYQTGHRVAFQNIEGDSYPTTTNGEPSEFEVGHDAPAEFYDDGGYVSPSPQRLHPNQSARSSALQPPQQQQILHMPVPNHGMNKPSPLFQQSAHIRDQQRFSAPQAPRPGQNFQTNANPLPSSQPPTYSQANPTPAVALPLKSNFHSNTRGQSNQPPKQAQQAHRQLSGPSRVQFQAAAITKPIEPPAQSKRPYSVRAKVDPVPQQQPIMQAPVEEIQTVQNGDYDRETLLTMRYEDLKNEGFDLDPRAEPSVLTEEVLQKPLVERLEYVQQNLDVGEQSHFFSSLPTSEWEDAGDWFLDQFQSIIQRTKQARQSKRKLAQEFEDEVEKRHKHVSKKQHQVQEAMAKMKAQGEGLVPRSPRPSKSPRPKRS